MSKYLFGFIGTGNMGSALAEAVCKTVSPEKIILSNRTKSKAEELASKLSAVCGSNIDVAKESKYIFLGVKPQMMPALLKDITPTLKERTDEFFLVSMAAGISVESLENMADKKFNIIRIMPNTPASIGKGIILYCGNCMSLLSDEFADSLSSAGITDKIDEKQMDAASALSGCGPAFVYMFAQSLADGAVLCGLSRDKALSYAANTLIGASELMLKSDEHPESLKDKVCSPGGSTICGVKALEKNGFRNACEEAVISAYNRTKELGK